MPVGFDPHTRLDAFVGTGALILSVEASWTITRIGDTGPQGPDHVNRGSNDDSGENTSIVDPTSPIMPMTANQLPKIDTVKDQSWVTGNVISGGATSWKDLYFVNISFLRKKNPGQTIDLSWTIDKLGLPDQSAGVVGIGYYLWVPALGQLPPDTTLGIPILPYPDANNAFLPLSEFYPDGPSTSYIGLWNNDGVFNAASFISSGEAHTYNSAGVDFLPSDWPAARGALGFNTIGGANAWANAMNEFQAATNEGFVPTPYVAFAIDFGAAAPPGNTPDLPAEAVTLKCSLYSGKTFFEYDANNNLLTPPPTGQGKVITGTFSHKASWPGSTITLTIDPKGKMALQETQNVAGNL